MFLPFLSSLFRFLYAYWVQLLVNAWTPPSCSSNVYLTHVEWAPVSYLLTAATTLPETVSRQCYRTHASRGGGSAASVRTRHYRCDQANTPSITRTDNKPVDLRLTSPPFVRRYSVQHSAYSTRPGRGEADMEGQGGYVLEGGVYTPTARCKCCNRPWVGGSITSVLNYYTTVSFHT